MCQNKRKYRTKLGHELWKELALVISAPSSKLLIMTEFRSPTATDIHINDDLLWPEHEMYNILDDEYSFA
jgi:hypothetical protein